MSHNRNSTPSIAPKCDRIAYILAGGQSRRFGEDKATYVVGDRRLLDHVADAIRPAVDEVVVVRSPDHLPLAGYRNITDRVAGEGPLAGVAVALADARRNGAIAITVGCDLLGLQSDWLRILAESAGEGAAAFRTDRWQGDLAAWHPTVHDEVRRRVRSNDRSLRGSLDALGAALDVPVGWGGLVRANTKDSADAYVAARSPTRRVKLADGRSDVVAVEEPLEIRLETIVRGHRQTRPISITMRTPGDDVSLAVGFLHGEGIVTAPGDVERAVHCDDGANPNVVNVRLADHVEVDLARLQRNFYTTSSCGVCGKTSLEALEVFADPVERVALEPEVVGRLPDLLRERQPVFEQTGAIHGAGLFTSDGGLIDVREDVGRHNALDKLVGARVLAGESMSQRVVCLSGRASFELLQKALMARVGAVVAVGAPSSLAVELARTNGIALYGFVRGGSFNEYA